MINLTKIVVLSQLQKQVFPSLFFVRTVLAEMCFKRLDDIVEGIHQRLIMFFDDIPNEMQLRIAIPATDSRHVDVDRTSHDIAQFLGHPGHIPVFIGLLDGHMFIGQRIDNFFKSVEKRVFEIFPLEYAVAQRIDRFALRIHDIVIFEKIFTDIEVPPFHALLGGFYRSRYQTGLNGNIGLIPAHSKYGHFVLEFLATKNAQQIVVKRKEKSAHAGIPLTTGTTAQLIVNTARFMAFRPENIQTACGHHFFFFGRALFAIFLQKLRIARIVFITADFQAGHKLGIAAQENVRASPGHVGRDGHRPLTARLRNDLRLTAVVLGIENIVRNAKFCNRPAEDFALFDAHRSHENRLPLFMTFANLRRNGLDFDFFIKVDDVVIIFANDVFGRRNTDDVQFVYLLELFRFRVCRAGHSRKFIVHAEVILERDGGKSLAFRLNFHPFFGLNGLMQPIGPTTTVHHASRKVIDDDNLAILYDIILIQFVKRMRLKRLVDMMQIFYVFGIVDIINLQMLFEFLNPRLIERHTLSFFVHRIIFVTLEKRYQFVDLFVQIEILFQLTRNDERRPCLVN